MTMSEESTFDPRVDYPREGQDLITVSRPDDQTSERRPWDEGDYIMALPTSLAEQFPGHIALIPDGKPMCFPFRVIACTEDFDENTPDIEIQVSLENDSYFEDGTITGWVKSWFEYGERNIPQEIYADDSPNAPIVGIEFTPFEIDIDPDDMEEPTSYYICQFFVHED